MPDRRDASIDRLLRAAHRPTEGGVSPGCLDAETLAAWMDNQLGAAALARAEAHAGSCARCQGMLAVMARTAVQGSGTLPAGRPTHRTLWRMLPWAAPLTAAATAAALWVAVRPQPATRSVDSVMTSAERSAAPVPQPSTPAQPESLGKDQAESLAKEGPRPGARADAGAAPMESDARRQKAAAPIAPDEKGAARKRGAVAEEKPQRQLADAVQSRASEQGARGAVASTPPSPPAAPAPPPVPVVGGATARDDPRARFAGAVREEALLETVAVPVVILSPDPSARWRITSGSLVERSTDEGRTWTRQTLGESKAVLTAGAAPLSTVCWIVGRAGAVFRTTDGLTWQRLPFPSGGDLIGVVAASADAATVTLADGRAFSTKDGGKTWEQ